MSLSDLRLLQSYGFFLAGLSWIAFADDANAQTSTGTMSITATVVSGCGLDGGALNFGEYTSGQSGDLDAVGEISFVNCDGELTFELDGGQSGSVGGRRMLFDGNELAYQLYRNPSRTAVWGTGSDSQSLLLLAPQSGTIDVYGRIPGGQSVPGGAYADTVNVTLTF